MRYKYEYKTAAERDALIQEHSNLVLVEEQNITDGNFLVFVDAPEEPQADPVTAKLAVIEQQNLTIMSALADLYETVATTPKT